MTTYLSMTELGPELSYLNRNSFFLKAAFVILSLAPLYAQNHISVDSTWTEDITLTGDIIIDAGVTLTINSGITIKVVPIDTDVDGIGDIDIIVNGSLEVLGVEDSLVYFIPYDTTSAIVTNKDWGGIDINTTTGSVMFSHVFIHF